MNIYVGNLSASTTSEQIKVAFEAHGLVNSAKVIVDFETGKSRGFGFVDMPQNAGMKAIEALNGSELDGNSIIVNEAYEKKRNNFGGGGGYNRRNDGGRRY